MRDELEKRGLDKNGLKAALVERLQEALQSQDTKQGTGASPDLGAENHQKALDGPENVPADTKVH